MAKTPEALSSRVVYENKHLQLKVDEVRLPSGYIFDQAYFVKPGQNSVGIVAIEDSSAYLVRQYRYTARNGCGKYQWVSRAINLHWYVLNKSFMKNPG